MPNSAPDVPPDVATCNRGAVLQVYGGWFVATCGCGWLGRERPTRALARSTWNTHYLSTPGAKPLVTIVQRLGRFGDA